MASQNPFVMFFIPGHGTAVAGTPLKELLGGTEAVAHIQRVEQ